MLDVVFCKKSRVVNHSCQYLPVNDSICRDLPVNATGMDFAGILPTLPTTYVLVEI